MLSGYNHDYFSDKIGYFCGLQIELEANDLTCREKLIHIGEVVKKVILAIGLGTTMGRLKLSLSNTFVLANVHMTTHTHIILSISLLCWSLLCSGCPGVEGRPLKKGCRGTEAEAQLQGRIVAEKNRKWDLDVAGDQQGVPLAGDLLVQGRGSPVITRPAGHHHLQEVCVSYVSFKPESIISL